MSTQRHRIKRQVLEVHGAKPERAQWLHQELRRIHDSRLLPVIEACCSGLSPSDEIQRIDTLTVDLGRLDLDNLEEAFVSKCQAQLREKLSGEIHRQAGDAGQDSKKNKRFSQVELLEVFARTGNLPWWADRTRHHLLEEALRALIQEAPDDVARLVKTWVRAPEFLRRMIRHVDDTLLSALLALRVQSGDEPLDPVRRDIEDLLIAAPRLTAYSRAGVSSRRFVRDRLWNALLTIAYSKKTLIGEMDVFWKDVFSRLAAYDDRPLSAWAEHLRRTAAEQGFPSASPVVRMLEDLKLKTQKKGAKTPDADADPVAAEIHRILNRFRQAGGFLEGMYAPLRAIAAQLPAGLQAECLGALKTLNLKKAGIPAEDERIRAALAAMLRRLQSQQQTLAPLTARALTMLEGQAQSEDLKWGAGDAVECDVDNAGLVILWPFLGTFLKRLELTEKNQFKDRAAVHRAVALLQYAATEETDPPEYVLALNRILCGMDLETVFELDPPVSSNEAKECEALLRAVIAQAPILKKMSVSGFRGTFLLRKGLLSRRDGAWLLRVERAAFDVVLDRFPWSVAWVKLPWMTAALQVEW
ncbi:MAG: contractile injection system tape measure protein [Nitrospiria bacterium]